MDGPENRAVCFRSCRANLFHGWTFPHPRPCARGPSRCRPTVAGAEDSGMGTGRFAICVVAPGLPSALGPNRTKGACVRPPWIVLGNLSTGPSYQVSRPPFSDPGFHHDRRAGEAQQSQLLTRSPALSLHRTRRPRSSTSRIGHWDHHAKTIRPPEQARPSTTIAPPRISFSKRKPPR